MNNSFATKNKFKKVLTLNASLVLEIVNFHDGVCIVLFLGPIG